MAFIYAAVQSTYLWGELLHHRWLMDKVEFHFIEVIERFLTAIALLILGTGLHELFIHPLPLPAPLKVTSFHELKSNLGNVILLNMIVIFFGNLTEDDDPQRLVMEALGIGIISGILIWFSQQSHGSRPHSPSSHDS